MKKVLLIIGYWIVAMLVTALLLVSLDYDLGQAIMLSMNFLPSALALAFFLPKVDKNQSHAHRILDTAYIILGVVVMTFFLIFFFQALFIFTFDQDGLREWSIPSMLRNPIFISAILAMLAYGHYLLMTWLEKRYPSTKPITFTSDYKKVSLKKEDILYIETRDPGVWIVARDGQTYRNRNGITQWENLLGQDFVRIHRAFLVNKAEGTLSTPDSVAVAGKELPVSRKYRDTTRATLASSN